MTKPKKVVIKKDNETKKKMKAVFYDKDGKKIKTVRFGADGYSDYTKHKDTERKKRYHKRHSGEKGGVMTASTLAKEILWNKPTLSSSIASYKRKYNLK